MPILASLAYVGDGAWGMSMAETMTAVRHGIPVVAVVWNNGQWGAEKKNQIDFYGDRYVATDLSNPDFAEVARAMGAVGIGVRRERDLQGAVSEAFAAGKSVVLDVSIDSSELGDPFRRDALKLPTRYLDSTLTQRLRGAECQRGTSATTPSYTRRNRSTPSLCRPCWTGST